MFAKFNITNKEIFPISVFIKRKARFENEPSLHGKKKTLQNTETKAKTDQEVGSIWDKQILDRTVIGPLSYLQLFHEPCIRRSLYHIYELLKDFGTQAIRSWHALMLMRNFLTHNDDNFSIQSDFAWSTIVFSLA